MHESVKKFLEFMSSQSEEIKEKAGKMSMAELSAFAKENGFELAVKEFAGKEEEGEIAIGEAEAAAGGQVDFVPGKPGPGQDCTYYAAMNSCTSVGCYCPATGSGNYDPWYDEKHGR